RWALLPRPHGRTKYPLEGRMAENEAPQGATESTEGAEQTQDAQDTDWKAESRKWESRAKAHLAKAQANEGAAKRLAELEESQKSATEKAIDEAKKGATTEVTQRFLSKLVTSEVKALATAAGFNDPADALAVIDRENLPVK